jgi:hypothetical protein
MTYVLLARPSPRRNKKWQTSRSESPWAVRSSRWGSGERSRRAGARRKRRSRVLRMLRRTSSPAHRARSTALHAAAADSAHRGSVPRSRVPQRTAAALRPMADLALPVKSHALTAAARRSACRAPVQQPLVRAETPRRTRCRGWTRGRTPACRPVANVAVRAVWAINRLARSVPPAPNRVRRAARARETVACPWHLTPVETRTRPTDPPLTRARFRAAPRPATRARSVLCRAPDSGLHHRRIATRGRPPARALSPAAVSRAMFAATGACVTPLAASPGGALFASVAHDHQPRGSVPRP